MSKKEMSSQLKEAEDLEKRIIADDRNREKEEMLRDGQDASATILRPKYAEDPRLKVDKEVNPPSSKMYIPLGWDEDKDTNKKHYRKFYPDELENNVEIFPTPSPFNSYNLTRGQSRGGGGSGMFSSAKVDESGQASNEQVVGIFKGIIEVENKEDKAVYDKNKMRLLDELK
jgi:hypothetical protein